MDFLEKDLEDILHSSDQEEIKNRGLQCFTHEKLLRQVHIDQYGRLDLLGIRRYSGNLRLLELTIYELKNKKITPDAFWQTVRYIKGIKHSLKRFNLSNHYVSVKGVIVGRELDMASDLCFLPTINSDISFYTYSYNLNGLSFNNVPDSYIKTSFKRIDITQLEGSSDFEFARELIIASVNTNTEQKKVNDL